MPDPQTPQKDITESEMLRGVKNPRGTGCGTCLGVVVGLLVFIVSFYLLGIYRGS